MSRFNAARNTARNLFVVATTSLFFLGCAGTRSRDLDELREISRAISNGTPAQLQSLIQQGRYSKGDRNLDFFLDLAVSASCERKKSKTHEEDLSFEKVRIVVDAGANVDGSGWYPQPLWAAALCDLPRLVRFLTENNAKVDIRDPVGNTLISNAACKSSVEIVRLFKDKGAEFYPPNYKGRAPMEAALECKNQSVAEYLKLDGR